MSEDFVTRLQLQLREAALRDERRTPLALRVVRVRRDLPGTGSLVAALAVALLALVAALAALSLRGEPEPTTPKVIGSYRVAAGLSAPAPGFGAIWTADTIRNEILRIDPDTRRVVARIPVGGEPRVATGAGAVWAIAGDLEYGGDNGPVRLLRIDPSTDAVVARIPMRTPAGDRFAPVELQIQRGAVWAVGLDGALRVDPRRNAGDLYVPLAGRAGDPRGVVVDGGSIWVLTAAGRVRRYDAASGRATGEVRVDAPTPLYLFGGPPGTLTLLTARNSIALLDRASGEVLWRATLGDDVGWLLFDDGVLWVQYTPASRDPGARDRLARLDVASGRVLGEIALPELGVAGMAKAGRDLWVATPGGEIVVVR